MKLLVSTSDSGDSFGIYDRFDEPSSDEEFMHGQDRKMKKSLSKILGGLAKSCKFGSEHSPVKISDDCEKWERNLVVNKSKWQSPTPLSFLPFWTYQMYDSYSLAHRAAGKNMITIRIICIIHSMKRLNSLLILACILWYFFPFI